MKRRNHSTEPHHRRRHVLWRGARWLVAIGTGLGLGLVVGLPAFNLIAGQAGTAREGASLHTLYQTAALREEISYRLYRLGFSIEPGLAVVGRDGWLFLGEKYADVDRKRLKREGATAAGRAGEIAQAMERWAIWLGRQGVARFCYALAPDKRTVYPERAPSSYRADAGARLTLLRGQIPPRLTLDLLAPISERRDAFSFPLYDPTDSHWNGVGAALAAQMIVGVLASGPGTAAALIGRAIAKPRIHTTEGGDLAVFLGLQDRLSRQDVTPLIPARLRRELSVTAYDTGETVAPNASLTTPRAPVVVDNPAAREPGRLLWLRDSFGTALSPLVSANFRHVLQIHWHQALADEGRLLRRLVREWKPGIVLVTVVEREALSAVFAEGPGTAGESVASDIPARCQAN